MPDNNPTLRSTIGRLAKNVFDFQFTSTLQIAGRIPTNQAMLTELSEADKLDIAGSEILRAQSVMVLAADLVGVKVPQDVIGKSVTLDGDPKWQIRNYRVSPDGAVYTFLLIDGA